MDLNPLCIKTAMRNVRLNQVENVVEIVEGNAEDLMEKCADLIVANIHFEVFKGLVENEIFRKIPWLILSGLMRSQGRYIKAKLRHYGLRIVKEWDGEGTWTTILASA